MPSYFTIAAGAEGEGSDATGINCSQHNNNAIDYTNVYITFDGFASRWLHVIDSNAVDF
jgi:hypothetical protein